MDKKLLRTIYNICVLILLIIGAWLVVNHFVHFGDGEFTDNARQDDQRYAQLLKADAVTQQQYDQIHTNNLAAKARYEQVVRSRATLTRAEQ